MIYTVNCDYGATGEGQTYMVVITYANDEEAALGAFKTKFGDWFAIGAEVHEGLKFDFAGAELLISKAARKALQEWNGRVHLHFAASVHVNGS